MIIMRDFDWQFGISNLAGDFNMSFFDWDWQICSKNWFFRKIEIRKIGDIFAINYSEKNPDCQSSSKNPVVSKNWRSNYRGSTVIHLFCLISCRISFFHSQVPFQKIHDNLYVFVVYISLFSLCHNSPCDWQVGSLLSLKVEFHLQDAGATYSSSM